MLCGISPAFAGLFPIGGQIAHVLRTRAPCTHLYCYKLCTRLACVKHAASVRSEPGSNSRLKPVAWRSIKNPVHGTESACQAKLLVAQIHSTHSCSKTRMGSNRFWHIVSVVKERLFCLPVQQSGYQRTFLLYQTPPICQHPITSENSFSTAHPQRLF